MCTGQFKFFATLHKCVSAISVNDSASAACIDFGVTKKI